MERESSSSEEEDEELNKVLKISAIFSGEDVGKLDAFLPKNCIAETPPPSKGIAETPPPSNEIANTSPPNKGIVETPPPSKDEMEAQKRQQNLKTTDSQISNEDAALSTCDPVNAVKENVNTVNRQDMKECVVFWEGHTPVVFLDADIKLPYLFF